MRKRPNFVIPSEARNLALSAIYKNKISRLRLEMTIATQSLEAEAGKDEGEFVAKTLPRIVCDAYGIKSVNRLENIVKERSQKTL